MLIRHRLSTIIIICIPLLAFLSGCRSCSNLPANIPQTDGPTNSSRSVFIEQPVTFCWKKPIQPKKGKIQILIDSSGSMVGFQQMIPTLIDWTKHSVSQLQQSSLEVETSRVCQFNMGIGISKCTALNQQNLSFQASNDTNLHEAIRSAKDYGLTFILTDGVAATRSRGAGDCASGVDASCIARSLKEVIHAQSDNGDEADRGIWIVPLISNYDGIFYTEELINPNNFNSAETIKHIKSDIDAPIIVQDPKTGSDNRLTFKYRGPRTILLIVIARWSDVGRSAVQALWERAEYLGIRRIQQMREYGSGVSVFSPIEIYPGFLNSINWEELKETDNPADLEGTMDAFLKDMSTIEISCPKNESGKSSYLLNGNASSSQVSGCVPIRMLPAFDFRFSPVSSESESEISSFIESYDWQGSSYDNLKLRLTCSMDSPRFCDNNPLALQWNAFANYGKAADGLTSTGGGSAVQKEISNLSTSQPSNEPHRVFALSTTLESFYREIARDQRGIILAKLNFCHKR